MGTNGVGNTPDIYAGWIVETDEEIAKKTEQKNAAKEQCTATENNVFTTHEKYASVTKQKQELENCQKRIQKQIEDLRFEMKMSVARATQQGKSSAEIENIRQSYTAKISGLEGTLTESSDEGKSITELFDEAGKEYTNAKFANIASDNWFLSILSDLFNLFLDKGKYEQAQTVYNHMKHIDVNG